jgi:hypothetical protein
MRTILKRMVRAGAVRARPSDASKRGDEAPQQGRVNEAYA